MKRLYHFSIIAVISILVTQAGAMAQQEASRNFGKADEHASNVPPEKATSMDSLAVWLTKPFTSDEEKARSLYRWITENITYDLDSYFSGHPTGGNAETALKERKAVCDGYSGLFETMAHNSGLEVVKISGFAKGYQYSIGKGIGTKPNHAWNAIKINGEWKLMDCTWGAGYIGEDKKFHRRFSPYYFLAPPEEFIYAHFPEDEKWQLLPHPVSKDEFAQLVYLRPKFFSLGMRIVDQPKATIRASGGVTAKLFAPGTVFCMTTLAEGNKTLGDRFTFVQQDGDTVTMKALLPSHGTYIFRLFAKDKDDTGNYEWALDYRVESDRGANAVFPKMYGTFSYGGAVLHEPFSGNLKAKTSQHFKLKVPRAEKVAVLINDKWNYLNQVSEVFEGDISIKPGKILVLGKFSEHKDFDALLEYFGK
jgi:hypothetical protein